jgi:hypothetical protein
MSDAVITERFAIVMIFPSWSLEGGFWKPSFFLLFGVNSGIEPQTSEFFNTFFVNDRAWLVIKTTDKRARNST